MNTKSNLLHALIRFGYPPRMRELLAKHDKEIITHLQIVRTPLSTWTTLFLNIATLGEFERIKNHNNYSDYFHLHLNILTNKNNYFILEKNSVLNFEKGNKITDKSEVMDIENVPFNLTLLELLENTRQKQKAKFFTYKAFDNNCQVFIRDVLQSNGMGNKSYVDFIIQNTNGLFSEYLRKLANSVTDTFAVIDHVIEGSGIYQFDTLLSNFDLDDISKKMKIPITEIIPKDQLKGKLSDGRYIINLENTGQSGSHWVCFLKHNNIVYYFDSFGVYPVQQLVNICNKYKYELFYNLTQIQDKKSILCGWFCLGFLKYLQTSKNKNLLMRCFDYDDMFLLDNKRMI